MNPELETAPESGAPPFEAVIGLECHVQLATTSKMFTAAATTFGAPPNTQTDPLTLGLPGTLPVPNRQAIEFALRMGLACGCAIRKVSRFARKHYFYPDLPKGYQISQFDEPLCEGGHIDFFLGGVQHKVPLTRIHLEEDAGKNTHAAHGRSSLVDYNRAGVPLIEIVSEPALRDAEEAAEYLRTIRRLVRALGISDGNMEEGSLRCDANVSIRPRGSATLGTKTELKNINSFKFVQRAIEHEIARQIEIVRGGGRVTMETRGWDAERGTSHSQRSKEEAHDYRYFPDPDLPPLVVDDAWLDAVRRALPERPVDRQRRYAALGLPAADAALLSSEPEIGAYFDEALLHGPKDGVKLVANWIGSELLGALNRDGKSDGKSIRHAPVGPAALGELCGLIADGTISGKIGKEIFARLYAGETQSPRRLVEAEGLGQISDETALTALCQKIIDQNPRQAEKFRAGADKLIGFFVGQVMKETGGRARPEAVNDILRRLLQKEGT